MYLKNQKTKAGLVPPLFRSVQMNHKIRYLIIVAFFLLCAGRSWGIETKAGPVDITIEPVLSSEWVCYIQDGDLYIRNLDNAPVKIRSGKDAEASIMNPDIKAMGDSIFAAWVERGSGGNKVMFTSSNGEKTIFGKPVELIAETNATRVKILATGEGKVYILEFLSGKEAEIFINMSSDNGSTFKRIRLGKDNLDALYNPSPIVIDDILYIFFMGVKGDKKYFVINAYEIPSMKLKDSILFRGTEGISFIEAFMIKQNPAAIYKTMNDGKFVLEGVIKKKAGWKSFSIDGTKGLDVARMDYHAWEDGRILIVFSGEEREKFKQRIYAAVNEDGGKDWDVGRIDKKEFDNTRSWLPRMAVDGDKVVVVWEDSRDIRSRIRMKMSSDRGKTWMERDTSVSDSKYYAFRPRISFTNGAFYVAWHQFMDDEKKIANLVLVKLRWDDLVKMTSQKEKGISIGKKEALLRERVKTYWKGMIKKGLKTTYEIHDPFYKARIPFDYYSAHRGPMVYRSYNIEDLKIEGNEATVRIKVKYEVPKIIILGKETSMPPKEITTEDTYLFIDGTWYRKFVDAMSGGSAIDY